MHRRQLVTPRITFCNVCQEFQSISGILKISRSHGIVHGHLSRRCSGSIMCQRRQSSGVGVTQTAPARQALLAKVCILLIASSRWEWYWSDHTVDAWDLAVSLLIRGVRSGSLDTSSTTTRASQDAFVLLSNAPFTWRSSGLTTTVSVASERSAAIDRLDKAVWGR